MKTIISTLLIISFALPCPSEESQTPKKKLKRIPVYHGPGEYMGLSGKLKEGKEIILTGRKQVNWVEFEYKGKKYWMNKNNLLYFKYSMKDEKDIPLYIVGEDTTNIPPKIFHERTETKHKEFFGDKKSRYNIKLDVEHKISKDTDSRHVLSVGGDPLGVRNDTDQEVYLEITIKNHGKNNSKYKN